MLPMWCQGITFFQTPKSLAFDRTIRYLIEQGGCDLIHVKRGDPVFRLLYDILRVLAQNGRSAASFISYGRVLLLP